MSVNLQSTYFRAGSLTVTRMINLQVQNIHGSDLISGMTDSREASQEIEDHNPGETGRQLNRHNSFFTALFWPASSSRLLGAFFIRMGKNHRTDPAWKYGKEIEKTGGDKKSYVYIECMFCKKTITGGVKRMKEHLACTHKNVAPCPGVPTDVKQEIAEYMNAGNMKRQLSQQQFEDMVELGSYYEKNDKEKDCSRGIRGPMDRFVSNIDDDDETHSKMNAAKMKEMRSSVCLDIGRFFFENAIPFNTVESPSFISMCRALGSYGRGFQPPTIYELRTWILKEEEESTRKIVEDVKKTWTTTGVSILSDGWSDMRNRSF